MAATLALRTRAGPRTIGGNTAFDLAVKTMVGSLLNRVIVYAFSFGSTLLAAFAGK